jgi:hypothetical protein
MKSKWIIQVFMALTIIFVSCTKEDIFYDEDVPGIKVYYPSGQSVFAVGDTVDIHVEITDNDELHEIEAILKAEKDGSEEVVWQTATHSHEASYSLYYRLIVPTNTNLIDYKLEVRASDHHGNIGYKMLMFYAM